MAEGQIINWLDNNGWIVLSGGADALSEIRAMALSRAISDGGVAYISFADDAGDFLLEDMSDLGAPAGYIVDLVNDDNNSIYEQIMSAGVIVIEPGRSINTLHSAITQTVKRALRAALEHRALILLEGMAASVFGELFIGDDGILKEGVKWVENTFIMPGVTSFVESPDAQKALAYKADMVFIGIGLGSALVLGPEGEMETWGDNQVTITLGSGFNS